MRNYLLAFAISLCALPMPSEAGIFSRFVRVGSVLGDQTKPFFGSIYITSLLTATGFMVARISRKQTEAAEEKLSHVRDHMRSSAQLNSSASNFERDPSFAHYREAMAVLEKRLCVGAYASRCDKFKKEFSQEFHQPIGQEELSHKIAESSKSLGECDAFIDTFLNRELYSALDEAIAQIKSELYLANPKVSLAAYRAGYNAKVPGYTGLGAGVIKVRIGLGNISDTEEAVAAAEARMAAKKK